MDSSEQGSQYGNDKALRRAHKKSRKGCKTCKIRKVKCDEKHPCCGNCSRRDPTLAVCDFEPFVYVRTMRKITLTRIQIPATTNSIQDSISIRPLTLSTSDSTRTLELRLMHHYTTITSSQLPDGKSSQGNFVWSKEIPQLAFQSDLVMSALLSISALHHWALTPQNTQLSYASKYYFDHAVKKHRIALLTADSESAESLLATAILITHNAWLAAHSNLTPAAESTTYEPPLQTYYMARGIQTLFYQMWPWLEGSGYMWYIESFEPIPQMECLDPFFLGAKRDLDLISQTLDKDDVCGKHKIVYEEVIEEVKEMIIGICVGAEQVVLQRRIATMPVRLDGLFLKLVEGRDNLALVLLVWNLCLLSVVDGIWWLHGTGKEQRVGETAVRELSRIVDKSWGWSLEWPKGVVDGRIRPDGREGSGDRDNLH